MADNPNHGTLRSRNSTDPVGSRSETDAYLASIRGKHQSVVGTGRLIFALDATASRRPTWEMACQLQAQRLVFVGDALEESPDIALSAASALRRLDVPVFMFQEGRDRLVEQTFQDIARLTHGAYCRFDPGAAR